MKLKVYLAIEEMTIKEFAGLVGIDPVYMGAIGAGRLAPSKRLSKAIADITDGKVVIPPSTKVSSRREQKAQPASTTAA